MDTRPTSIFLTGFLLLTLLSCTKESETNVFDKHLADHPEIRKKYIYQSILRVANTKKDPDFNKLIRDVEKITIYMPPSGDSTYQLKTLRIGMRSGGYEELMDFKTGKGEWISLWLNESTGQPHYTALIETSADDYILDIEGEIDLNYISSVNVVEESLLRSLLN